MTFTLVSAGQLIKSSITNQNNQHAGRMAFSSFYPQNASGAYAKQPLGELTKDWGSGYFRSTDRIYAVAGGVSVADKTWLDLINLSRVGGLENDIMINGNFDIWSQGTTFTNPADQVLFTLPDFRVEKADGAGTAPNVNIAQETTDRPNNDSVRTAKISPTSTGATGAGMYWRISFTAADLDWQKFKGKKLSIGIQAKTPALAFFKLEVDDGISQQESVEAGTAGWAEYIFENISIAANATKLEINLYLADATNEATVGDYFFSQWHAHEGADVNSFEPDIIYATWVRSIGRFLPVDNVASEQIAYVTDATTTSKTVLSTTFVKTDADKIVRFLLKGWIKAEASERINNVTFTVGALSRDYDPDNPADAVSTFWEPLEDWFDISGLVNGVTTISITIDTPVGNVGSKEVTGIIFKNKDWFSL